LEKWARDRSVPVYRRFDGLYMLGPFGGTRMTRRFSKWSFLQPIGSMSIAAWFCPVCGGRPPKRKPLGGWNWLPVSIRRLFALRREQ
jgi:hypothetical protein